MRKSILGLSAISLFALTAAATPALAEDNLAPGFNLAGNVALVSDYRFRGFTQNNKNAAIQGGLTVTHDSGLYAGTWASSIGFAGGTEIDLFAGYSKELIPGLTGDVGVLYYLYPKHDAINGAGNTDFFEPYVNLTGTMGPAALKVGVNFAPKTNALISTIDGTSSSSAIYVHAEPSISIPNTPLSLDGHIGYAKSNSFLGGAGNDHHVWDYGIGGAVAYKMLSFGVHYVDTDEARINAHPNGSAGSVVFSLTASF